MDVSDRAVSTVIDVSLGLLLVGAAVLTLLSTPMPGTDPAEGRAEEVATTLAGSTVAVSYEGGEGTRTSRGTYAGLLADAAVSNRTPSSGRDLRSAVADATRPVLGGPDWRADVVATWRPLEGASSVATVQIGREPPNDVDVHVATMAVSSGFTPVREEALIAAERRGFAGVAAVLAAALDRPPEERGTELDTRSEIAIDLEDSFDSPTAAARSVTVGRVHVTVRAWSS